MLYDVLRHYSKMKTHIILKRYLFLRLLYKMNNNEYLPHISSVENSRKNSMEYYLSFNHNYYSIIISTIGFLLKSSSHCVQIKNVIYFLCFKNLPNRYSVNYTYYITLYTFIIIRN